MDGPSHLVAVSGEIMGDTRQVEVATGVGTEWHPRESGRTAVVALQQQRDAEEKEQEHSGCE